MKFIYSLYANKLYKYLFRFKNRTQEKNFEQVTVER